MSKRSVFFLKSLHSTALCALLAIMLVAAGPVAAQTPGGKMTISSPSVIPGGLVTVEVASSALDPGFAMGGFDFLIEYDNAALTLANVSPGSIYNDCAWEYFSYRVGTTGDEGDPNNLVRVVALAETNNGPVHPSCYGETAGILCTIDFTVTTDPAYEYQFVDIKWRWQDCGDNVLSTIAGDVLLLSEDVFDYEGNIVTADIGFPSNTGAPESCLDGSGASERAVDYQHGGVEILESQYFGRGDLNLNGIAYEVADYVTFVNFFLYGLSAFTVNPTGQIAASDVNCDGVTLSVADLVYLYRIIIGDAAPCGFKDSAVDTPVAADTASLIQNTDTRIVSLNYPGMLSAVFMIFDGEIAVTGLLPEHDVVANFIDGQTRVLISPPLSSGGLTFFGSGSLFTYTGVGTMAYAEAAGPEGEVVPIKVSVSSDCCVMRGDINHDGELDVSDVIGLVVYMFNLGPQPLCPEEANVNGDNHGVDISDLVHLVYYMFGGGPAPAPCS